MAMVQEELLRPLAVVDALFAKHVEQVISSGAGATSAEFGERAHFNAALRLDNEDALAKIPCLNDVELAESVPPFSLVRYRCLVQDVFEPEYYVSVLQEVASNADASGASNAKLVTSKYRESVEPAPGRSLKELEDHRSLSQRGAYYCVPLPGETEWARSAAVEWASANGGAANVAKLDNVTSGKAKRGRDDDVSMQPEEEVPQRPRVEATPAPPGGYGGGFQAAPMADQCLPCCSSGQGLKTAEDFGLNFPIPSEERRGRGASTACIVKLYDADAETLRVCDVVEVIGVLCVDPGMAELPHAGTRAMQDEWRDARNPSTALVPRLHGLGVRRLPFQHPLLPYTPDWLTEARLAATFQSKFAAAGAMDAARTAAGEQLAKYLGGDALAAEYLLMLIVARSFAKHGEKPLGTWSLNLSKWPQSLNVGALKEAAGELLPRAVRLEVTSESLNTQRWKPKKDFVANRLVASQLQLAAGTLLVLDETKMAEGQLNAEGVKSLLAIQTLVTESKLPCDFEAYDVKIPLEVSCLLVSNQKSLVKDVDMLLPMQVTESSMSLAASAAAPAAIDAARWLIGLITRTTKPLKIPDTVMHAFGDDFASARQEFKVQPELAHSWMALARARCLTFGEEELSLQRWKEVMELERRRLLRCREEGMLSA